MLDEKKSKSPTTIEATPPGGGALDSKNQNRKTIHNINGERDYRLKNYKAALLKLKEAISVDKNRYAAMYICYMYITGQGVKQDVEKARVYFDRYWKKEFDKLQALANQKEIDEHSKYFILLSYYCLQFFYPRSGYVGLYQDYLKQLLDKSNALALNHYADTLSWSGQLTAAGYYRAAADVGSEEALYNLGRCYKYGTGGVLKDWIEATKWYKKAVEKGYQPNIGYSAIVAAAEAGDKDAQYELAEYYAGSQSGLEKNMQHAVKWYTKAARQGHAVACYKLGGCCLRGEGREKDFSQAAKYFREAMLFDPRFAAPQRELGMLCFLGNGTQKDSKQAAVHFIDATKLGDGGAATHAAWCALSGQGLAQDPHRAFDYLNQAIKLKGDNAFTYLLLGIYYNYYADPPKIAEAAEAYSEVQKRVGNIQTCSDAQVFLAHMREKNQAASQNIEEIYNMYFEAAKLGNRLACYCLATWNDRHPSATRISDLDVAAYQEKARQAYTQEEKELGFAEHYLTFFFKEGIGIKAPDITMANIWRKRFARDWMELLSLRQPVAASAAMPAPVSGSSSSSSSAASSSSLDVKASEQSAAARWSAGMFSSSSSNSNERERIAELRQKLKWPNCSAKDKEKFHKDLDYYELLLVDRAWGAEECVNFGKLEKLIQQIQMDWFGSKSPPFEF